MLSDSEYMIVTLKDSHRWTWRAGDRVVVASTDYDMEHAEEFDLMQCHECRDNQIKIRGKINTKVAHDYSFKFIQTSNIKVSVNIIIIEFLLLIGINLDGKLEDSASSSSPMAIKNKNKMI